MKLSTHLSRFFALYILGIVLILLGVNYIVVHGLKNLTINDLYTNISRNQQTTLNNDYGPAPELTGISNWINSQPLKLSDLKGKVVLIDFWTYSCINCLRTIPYLNDWYQKYKDQGFVIIGVHTPEFAFEKDDSNVARAVKENNISYPVAQDNDYATWKAYQNEYWPAHYLIDKNGHIVYTHFGEGDYQITENTIRSLLGLKAGSDLPNTPLIQAQSPEMYFGLSRTEFMSAEQKAKSSSSEYSFPSNLDENTFAFSGTWNFQDEFAEGQSAGAIELHFNAAKVHFVASADKEVKATILVDGKKVKELNIQNSDLYTLYENPVGADHVLEIRFDSAGVKAFTFTFS